MTPRPILTAARLLDRESEAPGAIALYNWTNVLWVVLQVPATLMVVLGVSVSLVSGDDVLIDSTMSTDPIYSAALQMADLNILVMQLNVPSAKNTERFVGAMRRMGVDTGKITIVVG